jgi:hypothetical protein
MVMEEIDKDDAKQQLTLTTPPNLTHTSTASINGNPVRDPNHSSKSRIHPHSLGLDDGGMANDNSVWSKMSKIERTVGESVRNVRFEQGTKQTDSHSQHYHGNHGTGTQPTPDTPQGNYSNLSSLIGLDLNTIDPSTKVIWTICKIPRFTASGDGTTETFIRQYVRGELPNLPTKLFDKKWPMIRSAITEALQTKRAGGAHVVQDMKRKFLGMPPLGAQIRLK